MRYVYLCLCTLSNGRRVNTGYIFSKRDAMLHAGVNAAYKPEVYRVSRGYWQDCGRLMDAPTFCVVGDRIY